MVIVMDNYTKEIVSKYPYLENLALNTIFVTDEDSEILFKNKLDEVYLVEKLLRDKRYQNYLHKLFNGRIETLGVTHIAYGDTGHMIRLTKKNVMDYISNLLNMSNYHFSKEDLKEISRLKRLFSYDKFVEDYKDKKFNITVEGENYSFNGSLIISFLELPFNKYKELIKNNSSFEGIPLDIMFFIVNSFFSSDNGNLLLSYYFPSDVHDRIINIAEYEDYDYEAVNTHLEDELSLVSKTVLSSSLEEGILNGISDDFSLLEKALFVYINMCYLLTYNDEYYAVEQLGKAAKKHEDISYIANITLDNNEVTCFEFNAIYGYMLSKLGIRFKNYLSDFSSGYGMGHEYLTFRVGKFLVEADSVTSIINGDLVNVKINRGIDGLFCYNKNDNTVNEFESILNKVILYVQEFYSKKNKYNLRFTDVIDLEKEDFDASLEKRVLGMLEYMNISNLKGVAALSYLLKLRKQIFTKEEQDFVKIKLVRNNLPEDNSKEATTLAVIAVYIKEPIYILYEPNDKMTRISYDELKHMFKDKELEHIYKS